MKGIQKSQQEIILRPEYFNVTEIPGNKASKEQIERLYHRYFFAATLCHGKDVLEVACGAGMGLGCLARVAHRIVGGDIDKNLISLAQKHYAGRPTIELKILDAQQLPFPDGSFDVILLYEAIYYLPEPARFVEEAVRVLRQNGILIICSVNKEWPDFNPSPLSRQYLSARELYGLLKKGFFEVELYGAFLVETDSLKSRLLSVAKRTAVRLHLIPKTMKGKEPFKRIFFGNLIPIPSEVYEGMSGYIPPYRIDIGASMQAFKVLYAIAHRSGEKTENMNPQRLS